MNEQTEQELQSQVAQEFYKLTQAFNEAPEQIQRLLQEHFNDNALATLYSVQNGGGNQNDIQLSMDGTRNVAMPGDYVDLDDIQITNTELESIQREHLNHMPSLNQTEDGGHKGAAEALTSFQNALSHQHSGNYGGSAGTTQFGSPSLQNSLDCFGQGRGSSKSNSQKSYKKSRNERPSSRDMKGHIPAKRNRTLSEKRSPSTNSDVYAKGGSQPGSRSDGKADWTKIPKAGGKSNSWNKGSHEARGADVLGQAQMALEGQIVHEVGNAVGGSLDMPEDDRGKIPETALTPTTAELMASTIWRCKYQAMDGTECNRVFPRLSNLKLHRRSHGLVERDMQLSAGARLSQFKRHYHCPHPGCKYHKRRTVFGVFGQIREHYRRHGAKIYPCDKCGKMFAIRKDVNSHSKSCGTKKFKCTCGVALATKRSRRLHIQRANAHAPAKGRHQAVDDPDSWLGNLEPSDRNDMPGMMTASGNQGQQRYFSLQQANNATNIPTVMGPRRKRKGNAKANARSQGTGKRSRAVKPGNNNSTASYGSVNSSLATSSQPMHQGVNGQMNHQYHQSNAYQQHQQNQYQQNQYQQIQYQQYQQNQYQQNQYQNGRAITPGQYVTQNSGQYAATGKGIPGQYPQNSGQYAGIGNQNSGQYATMGSQNSGQYATMGKHNSGQYAMIGNHNTMNPQHYQQYQNQAKNQSMNQTMNQPMQPMDQPMPVNKPVNQSMSKPNPSMNQAVKQTMSQPVSQSMNNTHLPAGVVPDGRARRNPQVDVQIPTSLPSLASQLKFRGNGVSSNQKSFPGSDSKVARTGST
eukprot:CAMPEP_0114496560 /NCGR_PEP_ID=MMETSP0109-20121206/5837_1 /TAXON_ID=29199 /ORGANISM="Chlorarachnion reptans, Strain CCCM449" /LENGTH=803 /DNA_ID=CAMNT_0001673845 /DNA_START=178 /DNA_END=2589 /DNA_ORIENTATION=+